MSAIVDYPYYVGTYMGSEADAVSFPALVAHASRVIGAMTRWKVTEDTIDNLPTLTQTLYRLAVCSQVDFFAINGLESVNGGAGVGFTVGKVRVDAKQTAGASGRMSASVSPAAVAYLEQTGLLYPGVPALEGFVC